MAKPASFNWAMAQASNKINEHGLKNSIASLVEVLRMINTTWNTLREARDNEVQIESINILKQSLNQLVEVLDKFQAALWDANDKDMTYVEGEKAEAYITWDLNVLKAEARLNQAQANLEECEMQIVIQLLVEEDEETINQIEAKLQRHNERYFFNGMELLLTLE